MNFITWDRSTPTYTRGYLAADPATTLFILTGAEDEYECGPCVRMTSVFEPLPRTYRLIEAAKLGAEASLVVWVNRVGKSLVERMQRPSITPTAAEESMDWLDEARETAAQCWCDTETKGIVMDTRLAEAFARRLAVWMSDAARARRGADYYRGLVVRCGNAIGDAAKTCDDGSKSTDVLCTKVPELVESLVRRQVALSSAAQAVVDRWESPLWKNEGATAGYIYKLRDAIKADGVVGIGGLKIQKVDRSRMFQTGDKLCNQYGQQLWKIEAFHRNGVRLSKWPSGIIRDYSWEQIYESFYERAVGGAH